MKVPVLVVLVALTGAAAGVTATAWELGWPPQGDEQWMAVAAQADGELTGFPRVVIDNEEHDFGTIERDGTGSHSFVITNAGDAPLKLTKLNTTCKCTVGTFEKGYIPPGESTKVTLEWTAYSPEGPFRQSAVIATNDPRRPQITLSVAGTITYSHLVVPQTLVFDGVTADESKTSAVKVYSSKRDDLKVLGYEFTNPENARFFEATSRELPEDELLDEEARSGVVVSVAVKPGMPLGTFRQTLKLTTNLEEKEFIEVPIEGTVKGDLSIAGRNWNDELGFLTLGDSGTVQTSKGATGELKLLVRGPHQEQVQLEPVLVDPEELQLTVGEARKAGSVTIIPLTIAVPPGTSQINRLGSAQGKLGEIRLKTGHPQTPELVIKVRFLVVDGEN